MGTLAKRCARADARVEVGDAKRLRRITRSALQKAASTAGLFLTTEAAIADKPDKAPAWAVPPGRPGPDR